MDKPERPYAPRALRASMEAPRTTRCPSCGHPNRPDRRYCAECGVHLGDPCPACGTRNQPGEKFCGQCGAALTPPPPARSERDAERHHLTVLFCDLVGSTALAGAMDPEECRQVVHGYHRGAADAIARFGGHVAAYLGDGVLAYFGWPQAYGDDAERAVRSGLDLTQAIPACDPRLVVRVGIHTGLTVVPAVAPKRSAMRSTWRRASRHSPTPARCS